VTSCDVQWCHFRVVGHQVWVRFLFKHQKLHDSWGLMFNCEVQVSLTELLQCVVNVFTAFFLVHLEYFNKLLWLVVFNELHRYKIPIHLL
jgi:hypothetical protein